MITKSNNTLTFKCHSNKKYGIYHDHKYTSDCAGNVLIKNEKKPSEIVSRYEIVARNSHAKYDRSKPRVRIFVPGFVSYIAWEKGSEAGQFTALGVMISRVVLKH